MNQRLRPTQSLVRPIIVQALASKYSLSLSVLPTPPQPSSGVLITIRKLERLKDLALYMGKPRRISTPMAVKMDSTKSDCSTLAMEHRSGFSIMLEAQ